MGEMAPSEGWGAVRPGDRRAHYYREGVSLCQPAGRVPLSHGLYRGELAASTCRAKDDCAACRKALDREAAKP